MRKILIVAGREYKAAVRTKAFLIGLLSMPVMMFGSIIVQTALRNQVDTKDQRYAVVDRSPGARVVASLGEAAKLRNESQIKDPKTGEQTSPRFVIEDTPPSAETDEARDAQRFALSERVLKKELAGFLEVGRDAMAPPTGPLPALDPRGRPLVAPEDRLAVRYQTNAPLDEKFPNWAAGIINTSAIQGRAAAKGLKVPALIETLMPVPLVTKSLSRRDAATGAVTDASGAERAASFLAPAGLSVLMLMMVLVGTTPLLQSVFEEKTIRIAEVLLGSARPFELMMGKLLGMVGVSLTTVSIYLAGAYWAAQKYGFAEMLPPSLMAWFVVYQFLGVLMYGSIFIAIGAACSDIKETQSLVTPVMLLAMIPMFALGNLIERPGSPLAVGLSFFPFATPMVMIVRQAIPPGIPSWQPLVGVAGILAATTACVWAAGRIFRVGLLMQGKGASFAQMARWVVRG